MCVHGRYSRDFYQGKADWGVIARVKEAVSVPVVASGDLMNAAAVLDCLVQTGADGAGIARGAQGNPWIFQQVRELAEHRAIGDADWRPVPVSLEERIRVARLHVERLAGVHEREVVKMRTYFTPYFKGMPAASRYRGEVMSCKTLDDFEVFFDRMWSEALERGYPGGER